MFLISVFNKTSTTTNINITYREDSAFSRCFFSPFFSVTAAVLVRRSVVSTAAPVLLITVLFHLAHKEQRSFVPKWILTPINFAYI